MSKTGLLEVLVLAEECLIGSVKDWTAGSARGGKGNAGQTMSKTGLLEVLAPAKEMLDRQCERLDCRKCSRRPPTEKTGRAYLLNRPLCLPDNPIGQRNELNGTELICVEIEKGKVGFKGK